MNWQLIDSDEALADMVSDAMRCGVVAVDTEFMRRNTFFPQVALVQLCFADTAWLVDPLAISDPGPLAELLASPKVIKVLHSCSEDLEVFQHWLGVLPRPLFDTQRAAALLNQGFGVGYQALVLELTGVKLDKGQTCSNWLQRPLTQSQCDYAAQDVIYLLPLWRELDAQCRAQNKRDWVFADGEDSVSAFSASNGNYYRRIKSAWKLSPRQLARLIAVCGWRDDTARCRDKPRSWIIDDKSCLQLAQIDPQNLAELTSQLNLPQAAVRRDGEALLNLLASQRELPASALPAALAGPLEPLQRTHTKRLKQEARAIAAELSVAPEVLLQSKDYEALMREAMGEDIDTPRHWNGWRQEVVISPLRRSLAEMIQ